MKDKLKKVLLIIVLLAIVAGVAWVAINASTGKKEVKQNPSGAASVEKVAQGNTSVSNTVSNEEVSNETSNETTENVTVEKEVVAATETKLADGIKYSISNKEIKPEVVLKDNYYDTVIADMNLNFENYEGKTIQMDGLYFENGQYTFVGRYSTSNVCPACPAGYAYFEYEWHGDKEIELTDSESWIKVIGTLKKGNDGVEYYYIDADSIEVMNEKGVETVSN